MSDKKTDFFNTVAQDASSTAAFIAGVARDAQTTTRLHVLYNHAARPLPHYVLEPSDACFVQMPRAELASAVYAAARNGGTGRLESAKLWYKTRFAR